MLLSILKKFSLRAKLIIIYGIIVGAAGLLTSYAGSRIVTSTILNQASSKVHHDLNTATMVYEQQLSRIKQTIRLALFGQIIPGDMTGDEKERLLTYLEQIRQENDLDFLSLADSKGRVLLRTANAAITGDSVTWIPLVQAASRGQVVAATEILPKEALSRENPTLESQAYIPILPTPKAKPIEKSEETAGLVLMGAAPVQLMNINKFGVLYGGILLNKNYKIVDRVWELVYEGEKFLDREIGSVTIFLKDLRISTTVRNDKNIRAIGTRVSEEVSTTVLDHGQVWSAQAFVVNDWYISEYKPIRNLNDEVVGILYVGQLSRAYTWIRDKVVLTFIGIASIGFIFIVLITYFITRSITRPLSEMVDVTQLITKGDLAQGVRVTSKDEIGQLACSFNIMVNSLSRMKSELEDWANTLEQKVNARTDELVAMQKKVIQTQRLASVGKLAAGIAHEINNPLGGILVFSSLILEDMPENDPHRENMQEIIKQTMRCRDIVRGLLQFSRQDPGKTDYVNVNDILNSTLGLIEKQALFHNITVVRELDSQLPFILSDNSQMEQVFMNVILNAVQAMSEVGTLTIRTQHDQKHDMVNIEIEDTGCGIAPDLIDRIFDPFFTTKEVGKGTGLGLAIAYGIVTRHHGRMFVKSNVDEGSVFTIRFPVAEKVVLSANDENGDSEGFQPLIGAEPESDN